jgi:sortase (surface protein transpeptidase)
VKRAAGAVAASVVLTGAGAVLLWHGLGAGRAAPPSLAAPPAVFAPAPASSSGAASAARPAISRTVPLRLVIPAIGVNAAVVPEGTDSTGALEVPPLTAPDLAGWWDGGPAPGQDGPAVIAGHADSAQAGPLVFWNLRLLKPGDAVTVEPAGVTFRVTAVTQVAKTSFPTSAVYGPTRGPELRLVTCGGTFDPATGHYLSNVIAYATEVKA